GHAETVSAAGRALQRLAGGEIDRSGRRGIEPRALGPRRLADRLRTDGRLLPATGRAMFSATAAAVRWTFGGAAVVRADGSLGQRIRSARARTFRIGRG